jgi:hypothetical protein
LDVNRGDSTVGIVGVDAKDTVKISAKCVAIQFGKG